MVRFKIILILLFLHICTVFGSVIEEDSITKIIVKLDYLGVSNTANRLRTDFDNQFDKNNKYCAELIYDNTIEVKHFCETLNSAQICQKRFEGRFISPKDIEIGKNYYLLDDGSKIYFDPVDVTFKIEIYKSERCDVIWGGSFYFDLGCNRYETPRALLCEFGRIKPSDYDWRGLSFCN